MTRRPKGFLPTLFDLSFSEYLTSKLIRGLYRVIIVITVNATVCALLFAWWLPEWFGWGIKLLAFVFAPATALAIIALARLILEHLIVIYAIYEKLSALVRLADHKNGKETR